MLSRYRKPNERGTTPATGGDYEIHPSFPSSPGKFDASGSSRRHRRIHFGNRAGQRRNRRSHRFDRRAPHEITRICGMGWGEGRLGLRKVHAQAKSVKSRATAFPQAPQLVQADTCALIVPKRKQPISKHCGRRGARIDERSLTGHRPV